jgi:tight adherence protein C
MSPILVALALTVCYSLAVWGWVLTRDRGPEARLGVEGAGEPATPRKGPVTVLYDGLANRLGPSAFRLLGDEGRRRVRDRLDAAGRPRGMTVEDYAGRKATYTVLMGAAGFFLLVNDTPVVGLLLPVIGFFFLDVFLRLEARRRQERIDRQLPDFLDILAVSVSAGVGFLPALRRVTEITGGPLGEELDTAQSQMDLGSSRREAFQALRRRNRSHALGKFVSALLQAEELGVPLTDALADLATDMRSTFYQQARRRAANAAPRVALVVTLVIVPGAMILIIASFLLGSDVEVGNVV